MFLYLCTTALKAWCFDKSLFFLQCVRCAPVLPINSSCCIIIPGCGCKWHALLTCKSITFPPNMRGICIAMPQGSTAPHMIPNGGARKELKTLSWGLLQWPNKIMQMVWLLSSFCFKISAIPDTYTPSPQMLAICGWQLVTKQHWPPTAITKCTPASCSATLFPLRFCHYMCNGHYLTKRTVQIYLEKALSHLYESRGMVQNQNLPSRVTNHAQDMIKTSYA